MTVIERPDESVTIPVGLGEMRVTQDLDTALVCYGLGSCIGMSVYDPVARIGGMIHVVLPTAENGARERSPFKYASTGIPMLMREMEKHGAKKSRIIVKIAGGASMLSGASGDGFSSRVLNVGERNLKAIKEDVAIESVSLRAADVGGTSGRTLWLSMKSGKVTVRKAASGIIDL